MPSEARDELFDYFAQESVSGNLAHQLEQEEEPVVRPKEAPQAAPKRIPIWKRAVMFAGALVVTAGLLSVAMNYSALFAARQELAAAQERLAAQQQNTKVLSESAADNVTLSELYSYAVGNLGMREALGGEITQMGPLEAGYTVQTLQDTERKPTQVNIHLFGGNK